MLMSLSVLISAKEFLFEGGNLSQFEPDIIFIMVNCLRVPEIQPNYRFHFTEQGFGVRTKR